MERSLIFRNVNIFNRNKNFYSDVWVKDGRIQKIANAISCLESHEEIIGDGLTMLPGIIDDQVHFREPGLTHKATIASESAAAAAGGVTSFMEMPNTKPGALTQKLLQDKYDIAANSAYTNYSFFMGTSNENYDELMRTNPKDVCGIKIFMGSSTGNMLVDDAHLLEKIFANAPILIATHCEDESTILNNLSNFKSKYGDKITPYMHPLIRNEEGCYLSSSFAIALAQKLNTRLHILHISTRDELSLFENNLPLSQKKITSEVCVHHLYFDSDDYTELGNLIKCNPAIKSRENKDALFQALLDDRLDIIATDHAPHTWEEKSETYLQAPAGLPLVQHGLNIMLGFYDKGMISIEKIVDKMCHAPATCFQIEDRGYIDEGSFADLVLLDLSKNTSINKENIFYKCNWSPLEGKTFKGKIDSTYVNGVKVFDGHKVLNPRSGMRLTFDRL